MSKIDEAMHEMQSVVGMMAGVLDSAAGVEAGHAVMLTVVSPEGKVETYSNLGPEGYRDLVRFMAQQGATGAFSVEDLSEETKQ